jgi:GNAT superfamily N-acetyltransferase
MWIMKSSSQGCAKLVRIIREGSSDAINVHVLSIWDRYRFFASATEPDADLLWPGLRRLLAERYCGPKSFVVAGIDAESCVVCRALFTQSVTDSRVWHSGYLYTEPQHRRRGLGQRVLLTGLQVVRRRGGIYSDGYVARTNVNSIALTERLGYQKLPFVRVHGSVNAAQTDGRLALREIEQLDVRQSGTGLRLLKELAGAQWMDFLAEEFRCPSPMLPWKRPNTALVEVAKNETTIAVARYGNGYANVIVDRRTIPANGLSETCAAISFVLSSERRVGKRFFFLRKDDIQTVPDTADGLDYDHIFMHARVGERNP